MTISGGVRRALSGDGLRARAMRGALAAGTGFGGDSLIRLAGNLILTRILFPEAFGLMALVQVVMSGLEMFSDLGIKASIIQNRRGLDPSFLNTAWTLQVGRGVFLFAVTWVVAGWVAAFYEEPLLAQMLPVAGVVALLGGLNSTRLATASRQLTLWRQTLLGMGARVIGLVVTIGLALWLESVWALVLGNLVAPAIVAVLSHMILPGTPNRLGFEMSAARELIGFGKYIFLATLGAFVIAHGDRAILGKLVSLEELALYTIAFFFASVPLKLMKKFSATILFPIYVEARPSESEKNRKNTVRARRLLIAACILPLFALALVGDPMIRFLYDPRYEGAGPLLVLIALAQVAPLMVANYGKFSIAAGESGRFAILSTSTALARTIALLGGAWAFGLVGVIFAPLLGVLLSYPLIVYYARRYKGWDPVTDITVAALGLAVAALALWLNPAALSLLPL